MAFFQKKQEEKTPVCSCGNRPTATVRVLGMGCASCHEQLEHVKKAVENLGLAAEVEYVTDLRQIAAWGVMSVPAIMVGEQVVSAGKVLKTEQVEALLAGLS